MPAIHPTEPIATLLRTAGVGHEEQYPRPSLSGRCRFGEATFAGAVANEKMRRLQPFAGPLSNRRSRPFAGHSGQPKKSKLPQLLFQNDAYAADCPPHQGVTVNALSSFRAVPKLPS